MPDPDRKTISATQSPALWNVSPYCTRWMLWRHFADGLPLDSEPNARMDWGLKLQPLIIEQAAADLHLEIAPNEDDVYHRRGRLGCTRDAMIICPDRGPGALETKCVFDYGTWMREWDGGRRVPRHYEIQLQQQMLVGDEGGPSFEWGMVVAWVGAELFFFERKPLLDLWDKLNEEAAAFFGSIEARTEPDPFGAPIEAPWLTELFPIVPRQTLDLREDPGAVAITEKASLFKYHRSSESAHSKGVEGLRAEFLALAKENEIVLLPGGANIRVRPHGRGKRVDVFVPDHSAPAPNQQSGTIIDAG
jgi:YqaJ-like viral recombinase domain